jgi:hypothetical protein
MIRREVERFHALLPPIAIRYAECDAAPIRKGVFRKIQEFLRSLLMLEDFEKCDHVEFLLRVRRMKSCRTHRQNILKSIMFPREAHCVLIQLDSSHFETGVSRCSEEISNAAANVEKSSPLWRFGIAQEKAVARFERHRGLVAALICQLMPGRVRHRHGMPKMKIAALAGK